MIVINRISWSGVDFSYVDGDEVDLPDDVAVARVEAGLAEFLPADQPEPEPESPPAKPQRKART